MAPRTYSNNKNSIISLILRALKCRVFLLILQIMEKKNWKKIINQKIRFLRSSHLKPQKSRVSRDVFRRVLRDVFDRVNLKTDGWFQNFDDTSYLILRARFCRANVSQCAGKALINSSRKYCLSAFRNNSSSQSFSKYIN